MPIAIFLKRAGICLFYTAFTVAVPLHVGCFKKDALAFGNLEADISVSSGEVLSVLTSAVTLTLFIALMPGRLGQFLSFGLHKLVEGFLHAASYKFFEFTLDYHLV